MNCLINKEEEEEKKMTSRIFHLTSRQSEIVCSIFPPLKVSPDAVIGLTQFQTYNSIPNIDRTNNVFRYQDDNKKWNDIEIEEGTYELLDIENYLKSKLGENAIDIKPNVNTLKCTFWCKYNVDFKERSLADILGLSKEMYVAYTVLTSTSTLKISKINTIKIDVNIVNGSYQDGVPSNCLYKYFLHVPPGFRITEVPNNVIYLPLNTDEIDRLIVKLVDERHNLIDFRGEEISLELHLKI